jgi:hypothetical protein
MNLIIVFALLISMNTYLYYREVNKILILEFGVIRGTNPNIL